MVVSKRQRQVKLAREAALISLRAKRAKANQGSQAGLQVVEIQDQSQLETVDALVPTVKKFGTAMTLTLR